MIFKKGRWGDVLRGVISKVEAVKLLGRTRRSIHRYIRRYLEEGIEGLKIRWMSHYRKQTEKDEKKIVQCKLEGKHRPVRFIRDRLGLLVHEETVRRVLIKHHLNQINFSPMKPIRRFEVRHPNEL